MMRRRVQAGRIPRAVLGPLLMVIAACGDSTAQLPPPDPAILAAWVQYTEGGVEARAVVTGSCPDISIDGERVSMLMRTGPSDHHPNLVCVSSLEEGTQEVLLDGRALPVPSENPRRIVVMGDTGCRLSDSHGLYQDCDNDSIWPFAYVAEAVAEYDPDVIIYTGDYIYREANCPEGNKGCDESPPGGDTQAVWQVDWLDPAHPVHRAAPLVLVRGNHETCSRAGAGWFRYLDAYTYTGVCADNTPPWTIQLGDISLGVMDTARVDDADDDELTVLFAAQIQELKARLDANAWITTHRPFWGFGADDDTGLLTTPTVTLQDAVRMVGLPDDTRLIVTAHIHLAELIGFVGDRPPQLVVANGGTQLVPRVDPPAEIDGMAIAEQMVLYQYGFVTLEPVGQSEDWRVSFRDVEGRELESCILEDGKVSC